MLSGKMCALAVAGVIVSTSACWAQSDDWGASAKTLTITLEGTLGPVLSGSDPAGLNGKSATVTVTASEGLKPKSHTSHSATYVLPKGAITADVNGTQYTTTSPSKMIVRLTGKDDLLELKASLAINGVQIAVTDTSALQAGSWPASVLKHPTLFSPSPQNLTSPASNFKYTVFGQATVLGVTGTAANSDALDAEIAADQ